MELFIFSQDEQPLTVISEDTGLVETHYRIEVNSVPSEPFSFTVEADDPVAKHVKEENKVVFKDHEGDWRLMTIKEIDDSNDIDGPTTIATCEPTFLAELNDHIVVERRFVNQTADVALTAAVNGTRWQASVEVELGRATTNFYYISSTEAIWETIDTWGGEFKDVVELDEETNEITGCFVKIIQRLGKEQGQRFEIDHNTTEIGRTVLSYPKTALYGRGSSLEVEDDEGEHTGGYTRYIDFGEVEWKKSNGAPVDKPLGQKWVGDPDALKTYGYEGGVKHRFGIFSNQDYEDPEDLLHSTWEALQKANKPEVNYRLSVNLFDEKVSLGDTSQAIDRRFARPIEIQARVIAMEYDLMDIEGTTVVEMGQFLDLGDELGDLRQEVENIKNNPPKQQITEGSYPDRKPSTPVNLEAYGGMEVIQLYWDYADEMFIKHYEVYGSRTEDFVPDTQHLLWRGDVSAFAHTVGTDEVWYYRVRAVNYHGRPSDWSVQVRAATHRVLTEDIMWGPELAERMRELHRVSDIIGENGVDFDQISQEAKDLINQQARIYTDEEIDLARDGILSDLDDRTDYLNNRIADLNDRADGLVSRADEIDDLLGEHGDRFINVETDIDDIEGRISASIEEIERIDDTVTSNSLELEAQADLIKGKLDEITYTRDKEGILESIEQNTLEIEATAEGLQLNADAINRVDGVVEGHSAQLSFLNNEISTKVEESFVRDAIGDIEIGDRNYYLNTSDNHLVLNSPNEFGTARISGITVSDDFLESAKGNQVTISIMAKSSGYEQGSSPWIGIETTYQVDGVTRYLTFQMRLVIDDNNEWKRYSNTISIPSNAEDLRKSVTYLIRDIKGQVELKEPTLVIGNKAGSYQLAPEDILSVQENHWTEITQNSRKIDLQAESIIEIEGNISSAQASIEVMAEQITNRVTKTIFDDESDYLRKSIAETRNFAEGIEQTVSSIEIGGRNYVPDSQNLNGAWGNGYSGANIVYEKVDMSDEWGFSEAYRVKSSGGNGLVKGTWGTHVKTDLVMVFGQEYTFSMYIKNIGGKEMMINTNGLLTGKTQLQRIPPGYSGRLVVAGGTRREAYDWFQVNLRTDNIDDDIDIIVGRMQVEEGNTVTPWRPAFEDTDQRMTKAESEIVQLSDQMRFKVDVDGIVSEINLMKEGIRLSGALIHLNGLSLIDEAIIQNAHIADGTIERAKLERAIIGTAQIDDLAVTSAKISSVNADKINADTLQAITANMGTLRSGRLLSNNNNMDLNLNTGTLTMRNANFTLGNGARIEFTNVSNRIQYSDTEGGITRSSGFGVGKSLSGYPFSYSGTTGDANLNTLSPYYSGAIWNTTRAIADGGENSISGFRFQFRAEAVSFDKGIDIDFNGSPTIRPINGGAYNYDLGTSANRFNRLYVNEIRGNSTVQIRDAYGLGGWSLSTDWISGQNLAIVGLNSGSYNYNIGRSNNMLTYVYVNSVRANYLHGALQGNSARKFKKNEGDMHLEDSLEFIRNAKIVTFDWRRDESMKFNKDNPQTINDRQVGFIIDDLKMRNDYLVKSDEETIKKDNILFMHQHVIQDSLRRLDNIDEELNWQRIEYQYINNEVKKLKEENKTLKKRVAQLEESA
ncbi:phage tail protein [Oceanobacillus oncorhynchi subsp. oncorhynchi]|uniref:phage tail protein n=1 Tax=Oceanobacillus oncorhynchi TaxID=545501 RepID=UPI00363D851F